jgi:hypothetical protein
MCSLDQAVGTVKVCSATYVVHTHYSLGNNDRAALSSTDRLQRPMFGRGGRQEQSPQIAFWLFVDLLARLSQGSYLSTPG